MTRAPLRTILSLAAAMTAAGAVAGPARAGTYAVFSCATSSGTFANNAWALRDSKAIATDSRCGTSATDPIAIVGKAGASIPGNDYEALTFTAPAGTTIADWSINRRWTLKGAPASGVPRPYILYVSGSRNVFGGAGDYTASVRDALRKDRAWAGYPNKDTSVRSDTPRAAWRSLTGDAPERTLSVRVGCAGSAACTIPAGGLVENVILGSTVTVDDPAPPTAAVQAGGLLSGGARSGADPVTLTASDAAGVKAVEILDVTNPAAPAVVGSESYDPLAPAPTATDAGAACDFSKPAPCPQLANETIVPTALQAGPRTLIVRVTDAGGNTTDSGPYAVAVATPSDRGAANGVNATVAGTLGGSFDGKKKRPRTRTVDYGKRPKLSGTLRNEAGQPVAGAVLNVSQRIAGSSSWTPRGTLRTGNEGRWRMRAKAGPSRDIRVEWRSRLNDAIAATKVDFDLRVSGRATLSAPRSVRLGSTFTLRGRLKGEGRNTRVSVVAQGKGGGGGFQTFRDTRTSSKGRIEVRYRFTQPGSRGTTFAIRVKLLPTRGWPYAAGTTKTVRVRVR